MASVLSVAWVYIASNQYGYNSEMLKIFGLNTYPLFAWAIVLFIFVNLYFFLENVLEFSGKIKKILLFMGLYWSLLILGETIWYHVFDIQNVATAMYSGLPICDCLHAPLWMQVSYFAMGPVYFVMCEGVVLFHSKFLVNIIRK
ncbi:MAG: hypothetical protein ABID64_00885 [Nitrospirota bacterium]